MRQPVVGPGLAGRYPARGAADEHPVPSAVLRVDVAYEIEGALRQRVAVARLVAHVEDVASGHPERVRGVRRGRPRIEVREFLAVVAVAPAVPARAAFAVEVQRHAAEAARVAATPHGAAALRDEGHRVEVGIGADRVRAELSSRPVAVVLRPAATAGEGPAENLAAD